MTNQMSAELGALIGIGLSLLQHADLHLSPLTPLLDQGHNQKKISGFH